MSVCTDREVQEQSRGGEGKETRLGWKEIFLFFCIISQLHFWSKFKVVLSLCWHISLVGPLIWQFKKKFNNPLTSSITITQLSGLSWPNVLSKVNFVLMSMALCSTRCSPLWPNTQYPLCFCNTCPLHLYSFWMQLQKFLNHPKCSRSRKRHQLCKTGAFFWS